MFTGGATKNSMSGAVVYGGMSLGAHPGQRIPEQEDTPGKARIRHRTNIISLEYEGLR